MLKRLASIAKHYGFSLDEKWKKLSKKFKDIILFGSDEEEIKFTSMMMVMKNILIKKLLKV